MFTKLAKVYGWPSGVVGDMTAYEACVYAGALTPEHGVVRLTASEFARLRGGS